MPNYIFKSPLTGEIKEVFQKMNDEHVYLEDGIEWERVWTVPNAAIDTQMSCETSKDFVEKTAKKKGTMGDIWDKSAELAEKRKKLMGYDPIKEKAEKVWSEKRKGRKMTDPFSVDQAVKEMKETDKVLHGE